MDIVTTSHTRYLAVGALPPCDALQQVGEIGRTVEPEGSTGIKDTRLSIGAGLPPILPRLVAHILSGEFIDMADLLPDQLGPSSTETQPKGSRPQYRAISNILEWVKCFGAYIAVLSSKQPHRIPDLLGYMTLIIESHMEYAGNGWMGYD